MGSQEDETESMMNTQKEEEVNNDEDEFETFIFTRDESPIDNVCVYTKSAEITRTIEQEIIKPGEYHFSIRDLPQYVDEKSIRVSGQGNATILEIWSNKKPIEVRDDSEDERLNGKRKELLNQMNQLKKERNNLNSEKNLLESTTDSFISTCNSDFQTVTSESSLSSISEFLNFNQEETERIQNALFDVNKEIDSLDRQLENVNHQIRDRQGSLGHSAKRRTEVTVAIQAHQESTIRLQLIYIVSGASWRASYDARMSSESMSNNNSNNNNDDDDSSTGKLNLTYYAHIKQNTGEDWSNVTISLSTAEPTLTPEPPSLHPIALSAYLPRTDIPAVEALGRNLSATGLDAAISELQPLSSSASFSEKPESVKKRMETTPVAAQQAGGDKLMTSVFHIQSRQPHIPSNNEEHKVNVASLKLQTDLSYSCVPKKDSHAYLKTVTTNDSDFILLNGNVSVYFDSSFVANTNIKTVCPMEKFDLFLGPDPSINIRYITPAKHVGSSGYFKVANKTTVNKMIQITNNKTEKPIMIQVCDHLPKTSESNININMEKPDLEYGNQNITERDVSIGDTKAQEVNFDPSQCHVTWRLIVNPQSKIKIPFVYSVEWPKNDNISGNLI